jgi:copper chaperone NosL
MEVQMKLNMNMYWLLPLTLVMAISGCNKQPTAVTPHELTAGDSCSLDGMSLLDFPGPKAQIHYANGETDLFCDTTEMFSIYLQPEQKKRVTGIFTQNMSQASWEEPRNNWMDANQMFFVLGSKRHGAMGPTIPGFATQKDADTFAETYGGKVYRFDQVTMDMVDLSGGVIRDEQM